MNALFAPKPAVHHHGHDLPCGCCIDVTEERGGHWWRFQLIDRDFLCRKAARLKGRNLLTHWHEGYAKQKEAER